MGTDRVEIAQNGHAEFGFGFGDIVQDLFHHKFRGAVRIGSAAYFAIFGNRNDFRITVNGGGRTEDEIPHAGFFHFL